MAHELEVDYAAVVCSARCSQDGIDTTEAMLHGPARRKAEARCQPPPRVTTSATEFLPDRKLADTKQGTTTYVPLRYRDVLEQRFF